MDPTTIFLIISVYFLLLIAISFITARKDDNAGFFLGNKKSPWYIVAFGMIGASLSGVTFVSVPGWVGSSQFSYVPVVLGYLLGYIVIANILLPLYYKLNLTSIYTYLQRRFGFFSYKTGASFFLLSRVIGASFRLFLVANVLQITMFDKWGVPFEVTVIMTILLIWLYTFRGGIKTIIWTDTLQTLFMLSAVGLSVYYISDSMNLDFSGMVSTVMDSEYSKMFFFDDWNDKRHFIKQLISGMFITIVMTGLDQDMMQKNLSCRNIREAKKNMYWFSIVLVPVNIMFLFLGAILFIFAKDNGIALPAMSDDLFPIIATQGYLSPMVGIFFIVGLIAAAYSSADSALTSLTTSYTIDILNGRKFGEKKLKRTRKYVHVAFSVLLVLVILIFKTINNQSVISSLLTIAGYTYGPLLGMYSFGLFTKFRVKDHLVPMIAIFSPLICILVNYNSEAWFNGYKMGFELLILNGAITFIGLLLIRRR